MRLLIALLPRAPRGALPDWSARPHRVLYVRHQRIGDLIMATGTIRAIATSHSTITVDVLASPGNATVLQGNPYVHRVLVFDKRRWRTWPRLIRQLRRSRYDVLVDGQVNHEAVFTTEVALMVAAGVRRRVGAHRAPGDRLYTTQVPVDRRAHFVEQTAATATVFGVNLAAVDLHPVLRVSDAERASAELAWAGAAREAGRAGGGRAMRVLVNVSVAERWRRWPEERFIATVRHLLDRNPRPTVVVIGAPSDDDEVRRIGSTTGIPAQTPGLRDAIALVATADLVVTPNTGIAHVASAFSTPLVELLPSSHASFAAYRTPGRSLVGAENNLTSISLERALDAVDEVLGELHQPAARTFARPAGPAAAQ